MNYPDICPHCQTALTVAPLSFPISLDSPESVLLLAARMRPVTIYSSGRVETTDVVNRNNRVIEANVLDWSNGPRNATFKRVFRCPDCDGQWS